MADWVQHSRGDSVIIRMLVQRAAVLVLHMINNVMGGGGGDSSIKCPDVCVGSLIMYPL